MWLRSPSAILLVAPLLLAGCSTPDSTGGRTYPLTISENNRYLVQQDDKPFLMNADTAWFVFDELATEDYEVYLDRRAATGFNTLQIMAPWHYSRSNFYGEDPFTVQGDLSTPNEAWWARVDTFVAKAAARDMLVNMVPLWLGYTNAEWGIALPRNSPETCFEFGEFLGERFKDKHNVMWTLGGDHDPTPDIYEREDQIGLGIHSKAPHHLISAHTGENKSSVDMYGDTDWLTVNATYTYFPEWYDKGSTPVYVQSQTDYERSRTMPFFLMESGYEDTGHTGQGGIVGAEIVRRQAYWSALSGSTGFAYGNVDIWPFKTDGDPPAWLEALEDPGATQVSHAYRMLSARDWHDLVPDFDHAVVTDGFGTYWKRGVDNGNDYVTTARTANGSLVIAYIPPNAPLPEDAPDDTAVQSRTLTVDMTQLDGEATASWFNPVDATYTIIGSFPNTGTRTFTTPGDNGDGNSDWVLLIETEPGNGR